jgi:hypothetical protein
MTMQQDQVFEKINEIADTTLQYGGALIKSLWSTETKNNLSSVYSYFRKTPATPKKK